MRYCSETTCGSFITFSLKPRARASGRSLVFHSGRATKPRWGGRASTSSSRLPTAVSSLPARRIVGPMRRGCRPCRQGPSPRAPCAMPDSPPIFAETFSRAPMRRLTVWVASVASGRLLRRLRAVQWMVPGAFAPVLPRFSAGVPQGRSRFAPTAIVHLPRSSEQKRTCGISSIELARCVAAPHGSHGAEVPRPHRCDGCTGRDRCGQAFHLR